MEELLKKAKEFSYTSLEYTELEQLEDIIIQLEDENHIFVCKEEEKRRIIYWGADSQESFLKGIDSIIKTLEDERPKVIYIEFIPNDCVKGMKDRGFKVVSNFVDYWIRDLSTLVIDLPDTPTIRPAYEGDCQRISDITISCRDQSRGFNGETVECVKENYENSNSIIYVAHLDGSLVGMGCFKLYGFDSEYGTTLWIRELAVEPKYHSRGIGGALLKYGLTWGIRHGAKRSFLAADEENWKGIKLYEKYGFKKNLDSGQINMEL